MCGNKGYRTESGAVRIKGGNPWLKPLKNAPDAAVRSKNSVWQRKLKNVTFVLKVTQTFIIAIAARLRPAVSVPGPA